MEFMVSQISAVINTLNEEKNIEKAIKSLSWVNEIVVVDDGSTDRTLKILEKLKIKDSKLKIFKHQSAGYVEPVRNYAISKAVGDWILILDADEEIKEILAKRLQEIASKMDQIDYVGLPRKNLIFGHFMQASGWWPDYNVRFFRKGKVEWSDKIHRSPKTSGQGLNLPADEKYAIVHYSYETISQFLERMDKYTNVQAGELKKEGYKFDWKDLFEKPLSEFLSRFFANNGYKDGLHGLSLSLLQAFSFMIVYLKLWESSKFNEQDIDLIELKSQRDKSAKAIDFWIKKSEQSRNFFERLFKRVKN